MKISGIKLNEGDRVLLTGHDPWWYRIARWLTRGRWPKEARNGLYVVGRREWED